MGLSFSQTNNSWKRARLGEILGGDCVFVSRVSPVRGIGLCCSSAADISVFGPLASVAVEGQRRGIPFTATG